MRTEVLPSREWLRLANRWWKDPLDASFAAKKGGRWNPPGSYPTLYLCDDVPTARRNVQRFIAAWPYDAEDLLVGPDLVTVRLPGSQRVVDAHTRAGLLSLGLPSTYPQDDDGDVVSHAVCQLIGSEAHGAGHRGVHSLSAVGVTGDERELAWFPPPGRRQARLVSRRRFDDWFH